MIVIGAGGFAIEILEILVSKKYGYTKENLFFFDDVNIDQSNNLFDEFKILKSMKDVEIILTTISKDFCLGIGGTSVWKNISEEFEILNGNLKSIISSETTIGSFKTIISSGCNIMDGVRITNNVKIGKGVLLNLNSTIGHDVVIENYCDLNPGVHISGGCYIESGTTIGTGAVVLPNKKIGKNVVIGAGSVIIKDVPDNSVVVGVPGKIIKTNSSKEA